MTVKQRIRAMEIEKEMLDCEKRISMHLEKGRVFVARVAINKMVELEYEYSELTGTNWRYTRRTVYANI